MLANLQLQTRQNGGRFSSRSQQYEKCNIVSLNRLELNYSQFAGETCLQTLDNFDSDQAASVKQAHTLLLGVMLANHGEQHVSGAQGWYPNAVEVPSNKGFIRAAIP
eukprot:scaffold50591_cov16-Tisochrysis_lutea.AAC.1